VIKIALIFFPFLINAQSYCSPYHSSKKINDGNQIHLNTSFALCFHYNAITYGFKYESIFIEAVLMNRTNRMPMMNGEQYAVVGYSNKAEAGVGIMKNGMVGMIGYKKQTTKNTFLTARFYQTTQPMQHIAFGIGLTF
jgi:hypothetical protein